MYRVERARSRSRIAVIAAAMLLALVALVTPLTPAVPAAATVPSATSTTSIISVKVGGQRTSNGTVASLGGVTLQLHWDSNGTFGSPVAESWGECVSDDHGDCSFRVPETNNGFLGTFIGRGENYGRRFWVAAAENGAPPNWTFNASFRTGDASGSASQTSMYRFQTPQTYGNTVYRSGQHFMTTAQGSDGVWQLSNLNPAVEQPCGIDVAFVLDYSGSMSSHVGAMASAVASFVNDLVGTPSRASLVTFATNSPTQNAAANFPSLASVATPAEASAFISHFATGASPNYSSRWAADSGDFAGTNWDAALRVVAANNLASNAADLVVFLTDGNPSFGLTSTGARFGNGSVTGMREVEASVQSANAIRAQGSRIVALGVGSGAMGAETRLNLAAISGPELGSDYHQVSTFGEAGAILRSLTPSTCAGTLVVNKLVVPDGGTIATATAANGWGFTASSRTTNLQIAAPASRVTGTNGQVSFPVTITDHRVPQTVRAIETAQTNYTLLPVNGANAQCRRSSDNAVVAVSNLPNGFEVPIRSTETISCTVYNQEGLRPATVQVDKRWVVNGTTYTDATRPSWLSAMPKITGQASPSFGTTYSGYRRTDVVTVGETATAIPADRPGCTAATTVTSVNGGTTSTALGSGYTLNLIAGANRVMLTTAVECRTMLTLVKRVQGGTASDTDWTLTGTGPDTFSGVTRSPAVTARQIAADATYMLSESGGSQIYSQQGEWACTPVDANHSPVVSAWVDASDDRVTVPLGMHARCTVTNATAALVLLERVENSAFLTSGHFRLAATPVQGVAGLPTPAPVIGADTVGPDNTIHVRPGQSYSLESTSTAAHIGLRLECYTGPSGAQCSNSATVPSSAQLADPANWRTQTATTVAVVAGGTAVYRFVATSPTPFTLPLTGGLGADQIQLLGGGIALLALLTGLALLLHSRRRTA